MTKSVPRILLVDDSPLSLACAEDALREAGFEVACATDLSALDQLAKDQRFDLMLMDVVMPEAFGDDVANVLRWVRGVETPILLLSSLADDELAQRVLDAELDGYIPKRLGLDGMVGRVRDFLASRAVAS